MPLLYVNMNKALCVIFHSSLLLYKNLRGEVEYIGFEINLCGHFFANNNIGITHMATTWHVNDIIVTHKYAFDITKFGMLLEGIYGKNLTDHRVKVHDYLIMDLDYWKKGSFKVLMIKYVNKFLAEFTEEIGFPAASTSADWLS